MLFKPRICILKYKNRKSESLWKYAAARSCRDGARQTSTAASIISSRWLTPVLWSRAANLTFPSHYVIRHCAQRGQMWVPLRLKLGERGGLNSSDCTTTNCLTVELIHQETRVALASACWPAQTHKLLHCTVQTIVHQIPGIKGPIFYPVSNLYFHPRVQLSR